MALDEYLASKLESRDRFSARFLIRDGFIEVGGQTVTRSDFPISTQDSIRITDAGLLKMPRGYFMLRELERERGLFGETTNALCIGADSGILLFLKEKKASVAYANPAPSGIEGVTDIILNPLTEKISRMHKGKFGTILLGSKYGLFTLFGILENNSESLHGKGRALIELRENETFSSDALFRFSERAGYAIGERILFDLEPGSGWLILRKKG